MSNPLLDLIVQGESGAAGYNAYNRGTYVDTNGGKHIRGSNGAIDFSSLTVGQVHDLQHLRSDDPERVFAVGKYQVIPTTMDDAILKLNLDRNQAFTPTLQDRIFSDYLIVDKRPDIYAYVTGQPGVTLKSAQQSLAAEWASFGDPDRNGASHYGGANHASITLAQSEGALNQMRASYQSDIARGLSPAEAWKDVTASNHAQSSSQAHSASPSRHLLQQGDYSAGVQTLQLNLIALDYRDTQGHPLKPDSHFGLHTRDAIEAFQRDNHLKVDGQVGHDTQTALQAAMQARNSTSLDDPRHADHPMYQQSLAGVHHAESQRGIAPGLHSERVAAALVPAAKSEGITHIDRVLLSERGERAFVEQKGSIPGINDKIAFVDIDKAIHTTIAQSTAVLAQVNQQQRSLASLEAPMHAATVEPAISGPIR